MRIDLHYWRYWWALHVRWWLGDTRLLFRRTFQEFGEDHCPQLAAGISYYVLFSIFPLAILAISISGLILTDDSIRQDVVDRLFDALPLSEDEGREDLERAVDGVATGLSAIGLISVLGLLWAAAGVMGGIRHALNEAWDVTYRRPFLRAKLLDMLMVTAVSMLVGLSIAATFFLQVARRVSGSLSDSLGPLGAGATGSFEVVALLVPLTVSFATFMFIYKVVPSVRTRWREIWPGALLAALLFEVIKNGFAIYLRYFGNYDAVYGSLGAVIAFLFFVYVSASILLLGAEMASEWPRVIHGHYDAELQRGGGGSGAPLWRRLLAAATGMVGSQDAAPDAIEDRAPAEGRRRRRLDEAQQQAPPRRQQPGASQQPQQEDKQQQEEEKKEGEEGEEGDDSGGARPVA